MKLPIALSVPHAGLSVPEELAGNCLLTEQEIVADGDEGSRAIYQLADEVRVFVTTEIARAVLDMNRARDDRRKDGVVKTHTCWDVPIWREPLTEPQVQTLFSAHHTPYHGALTRAAGSGVILGVDCHTMASEGPPVGPDPGRVRPSACLSNGDGTCPREWIEALAGFLETTLQAEVRINDPFRGGHITRTHAAEMPWVQLELSRGPFLPLRDKRNAVLTALRRWCSRFSQ